MRSFHRLIVLSTLLLVPILNTSAQILRGHITNAAGEPLPYATIYISEKRLGTATNLDGNFELSLPAGSYTVTFQYLGYKPVSEMITIENRTVEKNIILSEQVFEMPEVRVYATGKDRAYYIMRKAIGMAPYHLNQVKSYKAEVYIKGGGSIDKLPRMIRKQMTTQANNTMIEEGKYYFSESVNLITFNAPDKYVHEVISSRTNAPVGESGASPMDFIEASFYQPILIDVAISPLAPNAFAHYNFRFLGATKQGDFYIDKIEVNPKRKSQQLFSGVIFIVEGSWAIQSLDLTNENMVGTVRVKQLYMPVEEKLWMPVSHDFSMIISIMGIKAKASYNSSVKYLEVEPDKNLPGTAVYAIDDETPVIEEEMSKEAKEIETILSKDKITAADMSRLSRLNEKTTKPKEKEPLEVKDNTTYVIDKDATKKDSVYWEEVRPIPLTEAEKISIIGAAKPDTMLASSTNTLTISLGPHKDKPDDGKEHKGAALAKAVIKGKKWEINKNNSLIFDGLVSMKTFSFNTVDGFTAGTGLTYFAKTGEHSKLTLNPVIRYAFNRKDLMWNMNTSFTFNPMKQSSLSLQAGSTSRDFTSVGINPFINTISSLAFRYNWMKLYKSNYISLVYKSEITNGLNMSITGSWEKRETLVNVTDYSIFRPDREYTPNIPDNPFVQGAVEGYDAITPVNHYNVSFTGELTYTPRQKYRISNNSKINLAPDYPTFRLSWKHGYNYNDTISGHYDLLKGGISMHHNLGAMKQFRWNVTGGGFINRQNVQLQDMQFFNTQSSPVIINNYDDAYYLKKNYAIASPSLFAGVNMKYTTPCLVLKRLPVLSKTLMRENVILSWLWTPDYKHYTEVGYSVSEIFLFTEAGVYAGFRNNSFDSAGFRLILRLD